ncbi:MAG TPA: hypothetical protein VLM85_22810 [Polyangiaceae bacterium]|nr:hypothetical protein [Polyangiaceae bacterium]
MSVYRRNPALFSDAPAPAPSRWRLPLILATSIGAHVLVLAAAFVLQAREPAPAPSTRVVRVLSGTVDSSTGSLRVAGEFDARVRIASGMR